MRFDHVGMVVRSVGVAEKLCRERLKDDAPPVWGPVPAFQCLVAFSTRFPMIEFVVPEGPERPCYATLRIPSIFLIPKGVNPVDGMKALRLRTR